MTNQVMQTVSVSKAFGGVRAVNDVSFGVAPGRITGLIGPNGAGKTSLLNILAGVHRPDSGRVLLGDEDITDKSPYEVARLGVVRTFQRAGVFPELSTIENILIGLSGQDLESLGTALRSRKRWIQSERAQVERVWPLLERFGLEGLTNRPAGILSGGQKRLVELIRALLMRPKILLLDEPMAGVNPSLVVEILDYLKTMTQQGVTVVMIEHDLAVIDEICNSVIFMAQGRILVEGSVADVLQNEAVRAVADGY